MLFEAIQLKCHEGEKVIMHNQTSVFIQFVA
jgi:hypothetical protein